MGSFVWGPEGAPTTVPNRTPMRYSLGAQGLALLVGLAVGLGRLAGFFQDAEFRWRDLCVQARYAMWGALPTQGVALVAIDAHTLAELKLPFALWRPQTVQVLRNLLQGGAQVIAPDILYELSPEALEAAGPQHAPLGQALRGAENELALLLLKQPVLLGAHATREGGLNLPRPILKAAAFDKLALLNLEQDSDGAVRNYPLRLPVEGQWYPTLAAEAAQLVKLDADRSWPDPLRLDYRGPAGTIPRYSFYDVLQGQKVAEPYLFVGTTDLRFGDFHRTPFSLRGEPDMPGVEIHANALGCLLSGQYLTVLPPPVNLLWPLALAWLAGGWAWKRAPGRALVLAALTLGLFASTAFGLFLAMRIWVDVVASCLAVPLACLAVYALRTLTVERQRAQLVSTFGRMVSTHVMEAVLNDPEQLEARQEREVTVLFTDINNFTPTCEASTPAQVLDMLSDYFTAMVEVILKHDGYIKQYVGDEIMVIFGAPHRQEDHALRGVQAALEMQDRLQAMASTGKPGFYDIKMGLNTGRVILGKVGSAERWEYAAVGDDVNLGSRIMGLTKKLDSNVLVSENTRASAAPHLPEVEWTPYGEQEFKGKSRRVPVYGVRHKENV